MRAFNVYNQHLSGVIPDAIGSMLALMDVNMGFNRLSGVIPDAVGSAIALESLELSANRSFHERLRGAMPNVVGSLSKMHRIRLRDQDLSGAIPDAVRSMRGLQMLDLHAAGLVAQCIYDGPREPQDQKSPKK